MVAMTHHIVRTENLSKRYGDHTAVDDLTLAIPEGVVYGFLGPNGSGKSTTMKMLLSLIRPSAGGIEIMGRPMTRATRRELLTHIGSLIEAPPGYPHLTGAENMRLVQRLLSLPDEAVDRAVHAVDLAAQMDKKVAAYSLGMKQRLGIAMALARQPRLLILDEPTNGLDPAGIEEIRTLLRSLADRGVTVMVSSHLLEEIDKTATMLGILQDGKLLFQGSRTELLDAATPDLLIDTNQPSRAANLLSTTAPVVLDGHTLRIPGADDPTTARTVAHLVGAGVDIHGVRRDEQSLEDVFMTLTSGGTR